MSKFTTLVLGLLALFALSACSQPGDAFAAKALDEGGLFPQPNGLSQQETTLDAWAAENGYTVEIKAVGLGNENTSVDACDCVEEALTVTDPSSVEMIYAQVVVKGKNANPKTEFPTSVTVSAAESKSWTDDDADNDTLTQSFVNPQGGAPLTDGGQIYEGVFEAADTVTAKVVGVSTMKSDGSEFYQPRSFIIYIFRKSDDSVSVGRTLNYYVFHDSASETFSVPASDEDRDIDVTFVISELESDSREIMVSAQAGSATPVEMTVTQPDEDEVLVKTLSVNVPAGVTQITATVKSPAKNGDSVYWSGVNVTLPVEPEVEPAPGRFTGGGHVMSGGVRYSFGLTLHCDVELSNNLEINWGKGKNSNKWHLEKESLTDVLCSDDPAITQEPPRAPLDTMSADAVGKLTFGEYKNADGSPIRFTIVDAGEPGKKDSISVMIWEPGDDPDSDEPLVSFEGKLKGGNLQAHYDQPHGNKP